jgi:predicted TIM-barrel fold metal-dependent hydrolase
MDHVVIVTPSVYGTDNSATLDGIKQLGPERARGVAVIDEKTSAADVDAMHKGGIRGIRGILETGVFDTAVAAKKLDAAVQQVRGAHGISRSMRDYRSSIR